MFLLSLQMVINYIHRVALFAIGNASREVEGTVTIGHCIQRFIVIVIIFHE